MGKGLTPFRGFFRFFVAPTCQPDRISLAGAVGRVRVSRTARQAGTSSANPFPREVNLSRNKKPPLGGFVVRWISQTHLSSTIFLASENRDVDNL